MDFLYELAIAVLGWLAIAAVAAAALGCLTLLGRPSRYRPCPPEPEVRPLPAASDEYECVGGPLCGEKRSLEGHDGRVEAGHCYVQRGRELVHLGPYGSAEELKQLVTEEWVSREMGGAGHEQS